MQRAAPRAGVTGCLLACTALPTAVLLVGGTDLQWWTAIPLVVAATVSCATLTRRTDLQPWAVALTVGGLLLLAVSVGPIGSHDVWSYVEYGWILGHHGASPFVHTPAQFPHDPFLHLVGWRHTPSMYGPAFDVFAALGAIVAGHSMLVARLWHQLAAAGALAAVLTLLWRKTRDPGALAWLGLHPLIIVSVVNGGHNDLLVGLLVVLGVLALTSSRGVRAGGAIGLAVLVKITAGLGAAGAIAWAWTRRGRGAAYAVVGGAALVVIIGTLPFGLQPITVFGSHAALLSRASIWQAERVVMHALSADALIDARFLGGLAAIALASFVALRRRGDDDPVAGVGGTVAAYQAAGPYVLPWYCAWSLPVLAFRRHDPVSRWAWWYAAAILAVYQLPRGAPVLGEGQHIVVGVVFPAVALVVFIRAATRRAEASCAGPPRCVARQSLTSGPASW